MKFKSTVQSLAYVGGLRVEPPDEFKVEAEEPPAAEEPEEGGPETGPKEGGKKGVRKRARRPLIEREKEKDELSKKLDDKRSEKRIHEEARKALAFVAMVLVLATVIGVFAGQWIDYSPFWQIVGVSLLVIAVLVLGIRWMISTERLDREIDDLVVEKDILETGQKEWQRAYRLFRAHQFELRRYYNLALRHSKIMLTTGLICIAFGLVIIGGSGYLVMRPEAIVGTGNSVLGDSAFVAGMDSLLETRPSPGSPTSRSGDSLFVASLDSLLAAGQSRSLNATSQKSGTGFVLQIIIGFLGAIGGLLTNYVAAVYLKMYAVTSQSLNDFHNRLVQTHHLHMGNYIASKIDDEQTRNSALHQMSIELSKV